MGFSVRGNVAPDIVKPAPEIDAALTVTASEPLEVNVIVCAAEVLTATFPKATLAELTVSVGVADCT